VVLDDNIIAAAGESTLVTPGEPCMPARDTIALFVRSVRNLLRWKQQTLADFAGVSLSTVERVERAEKVTDECLDRIAVGLHYEKGLFTTPRVPLSPEAATEAWGNFVPVTVHRLSTQAAIRRLAQCHGFLLHRPGVSEVHDGLIYALIEWLDLASYLLGAPDDLAPPPTAGRRRELYACILDCVRSIEQEGFHVLGGVMGAPQLGLPEWEVAVVSITLKRDDPGAPKRREVYVDRRCVDLPARWQDAAEAENKIFGET
jgi:transcriptional regulator with XRE-family HTH domain